MIILLNSVYVVSLIITNTFGSYSAYVLCLVYLGCYCDLSGSIMIRECSHYFIFETLLDLLFIPVTGVTELNLFTVCGDLYFPLGCNKLARTSQSKCHNIVWPLRYPCCFQRGQHDLWSPGFQSFPSFDLGMSDYMIFVQNKLSYQKTQMKFLFF